jgi:nicotinate-nucleotide adenylyltransferase
LTLNVKRIGLYGGSFDPVHNGHLALANFVLENSAIEQIIFVPVGKPWQKSPPVASGADRKKMLELAIAGNNNFVVSSIEIERSKTSYTIDTVEELLQQDSNQEISLLLGKDAAETLDTWHRASDLKSKTKIMVVARESDQRPMLSYEFEFLKMPLADISSSKIREDLAKGLLVSDLVPEVVNKYIFDQKLYK